MQIHYSISSLKLTTICCCFYIVMTIFGIYTYPLIFEENQP